MEMMVAVVVAVTITRSFHFRGGINSMCWTLLCKHHQIFKLSYKVTFSNKKNICIIEM